MISGQNTADKRTFALTKPNIALPAAARGIKSESLRSGDCQKGEDDMRATLLKFAALLAGSAIAGTPAIAFADDVAGAWNVSGTIQSATGAIVSIAGQCVFQQTGDLISGTCQGPFGLGPASGTARGASIAWEADIQATAPGGITSAMALAGTLGPDGVIRGEVKLSAMPGSVGAFIAQRP
jgi:hypothetical protein